MTDVIVVDAYYTNQSQIKELAAAVIKECLISPILPNSTLSNIFTESSISKNADIQILRERVADNYYRLDMAPPLEAFTQFEWNNGQFTNTHPFLMAQISVPPSETNNLWTLYAVQPGVSLVSIRTGEKPLLFNEGFYLSLYGLPRLLRFNVIIQTADVQSAKGHDFSSTMDPGGFRWFTIDKKRLADELSGHGKLGQWAVVPASGATDTLKWLTFISPDGLDHNTMRILFADDNPQRRFVAYVRNPNTDSIADLSAWNYDQIGNPIRFLRIESDPNGNLRAWAQFIIYSQTAPVDLSLFTVDVAKFNSVYDQRLKNPIEVVNGKVVFDASRDKYAPIGVVRHGFGWFLNRLSVIRVVILMGLFAPIVIVVIAIIKKGVRK